jgi:IS30 family transposase
MKHTITKIVDLRLKGLTYDQIGKIYGITRQRVEQLLQTTPQGQKERQERRKILEERRKIKQEKREKRKERWELIDRVLPELREKKVSIAETRKIIGTSFVSLHLKRLGLPSRKYTRLTKEQKIEIKKLYETEKSINKIAKMYDVNHQTIRNAL